MSDGEEMLGRRDIEIRGYIPDVLHLPADEIELAIIRAVGRTGVDVLFSTTSFGEVFTHKRHGFSREEDRVYVTGISPVLADVAAHHRRLRGDRGGRFYLKDRECVDADSKRVFAILTSA